MRRKDISIWDFIRKENKKHKNDAIDLMSKGESKRRKNAYKILKDYKII